MQVIYGKEWSIKVILMNQKDHQLRKYRLDLIGA